VETSLTTTVCEDNKYK